MRRICGCTVGGVGLLHDRVYWIVHLSLTLLSVVKLLCASFGGQALGGVSEMHSRRCDLLVIAIDGPLQTLMHC